MVLCIEIILNATNHLDEDQLLCNPTCSTYVTLNFQITKRARVEAFWLLFFEHALKKKRGRKDAVVKE